MRVLDIAVFLFMFNLFLGIYSEAMNYTVVQQNVQEATQNRLSNWSQTINDTSVPGWNPDMNMTEPQFTVWQFVETIMGSWNLLWRVIGAVVLTGNYLYGLSGGWIPIEICNAINLIVIMIYIIAIVQWIRGISTGGVE